MANKTMSIEIKINVPIKVEEWFIRKSEEENSNLSKRIKKREINDEIGRLIFTLNQLLDRIEIAFERQKQFTADASHELRTPIAVIRAQVEEALGKEQTATHYQKALKLIKKQSEHMSHLVGQLLLLARIDNEENQIEKENFDIVEVIDVVVDEMQKEASQKLLSIEKVIKDDSIYFCGDQSKITQLFLNLLGNAIEYTPEKGNIKVIVKITNKKLRIDIEDTGIGILPEHQGKIFKRFYRIDKARSRKQGGTGLGLAISRWIVAKHGGTISVKSELSKGSTFTVILPL